MSDEIVPDRTLAPPPHPSVAPSGTAPRPHAGLFICGSLSAAYFIPPPSIASIANSIASMKIAAPDAAGTKGTGSGDRRVYGRDGALAWTNTRRYAARTSLIGNYRHVVRGHTQAYLHLCA